MINLYKVEISGKDWLRGYRITCIYTGTASNPSIAERAALKLAVNDNLINRKTESIINLGNKEFGR